MELSFPFEMWSWYRHIQAIVRSDAVHIQWQRYSLNAETIEVHKNGNADYCTMGQWGYIHRNKNAQTEIKSPENTYLSRPNHSSRSMSLLQTRTHYIHEQLTSWETHTSAPATKFVDDDDDVMKYYLSTNFIRILSLIDFLLRCLQYACVYWCRMHSIIGPVDITNITCGRGPCALR